jgi:glycosyltransferase 2 family protein
MESRLRLRKGLIVLARWVCAGILLYGAGRQIVVELRKLHGREINLDLTLLFVGALLYTAAMSCFAAYWRQAAIGMGGRPGSLEVQRAYFASQLGKYIPGKAWVILIRCALLNNQTTTTPVIIASTFYETLAMMAAGSVLALVALLATGNARPVMLALATGLTAGLILAVLPPVFGRLATWTARSFQKADSIPIATITYATWFQAFRYCIPGWMAVGLSLVSIAGSLGTSMFSFAGFLLACGGIALAIVGGFAVLIVPAGLGVREWVMMQTLGPTVGISNAALIAILARITHVSAELFVAGCLYLLGKRRNQK